MQTQTIDIDGLLDPVGKAPSEGDALRQLLRASETALRAVRNMLGGVDSQPKVQEVMNVVDRLLADMTLDSSKVDATLREPRSKKPVDDPVLGTLDAPTRAAMMKQEEDRKQADKHADKHAEAGAKR